MVFPSTDLLVLPAVPICPKSKLQSHFYNLKEPSLRLTCFVSSPVSLGFESVSVGDLKPNHGCPTVRCCFACCFDCTMLWNIPAKLPKAPEKSTRTMQVHILFNPVLLFPMVTSLSFLQKTYADIGLLLFAEVDIGAFSLNTHPNFCCCNYGCTNTARAKIIS